ncbi:hypothetical protein CANTEDRAFT_114331 [Yamadazyma tenuis ATCC 10573]|uniref:Uncharacterized protein n=3 Tax=Candida tenuis TaxID=2315449 RepID=G3B6U5_CANTC|nr:uncharacterized protein CANTEDRAFT_114331 [Yamadazyma tenuis ATCC 10573]EGV63023.1 hypothetical protein CANTEDRAFT_114331 [Yamadazyma tenuis ATCC 10573]
MIKPKRISSLTNKRLDDSKVPLLNKQASKLILNNDKENHRSWRVSSNPSQLMQFTMNAGTRNIESNGSENVE